MSTGDKAGLLRKQHPQTAYKHTMLDQYVVRFATKTASRLVPRRSVLFDGFAGTGRFEDGQAASAELMMLAAQKAKATTAIDCFLVEKKRSSFQNLDAVADEYRARGLNVVTRHGECGGHLDDVARLARGASLFLFIDPCGATLPWTTLVPVLMGRGRWPRTELLMNFNADLPRRAGGQLEKGMTDADGVRSLDLVCGGPWWRQVALEAHKTSGRDDWEHAAHAVAVAYARRLGASTGMSLVVAPVRRKEHHQPVYYLIFLTHDKHGLWVFADAAARAREEWLNALGPDDDELEGMLFNTTEGQIDQERERAVRTVKANLLGLLDGGRDLTPGEHPTEVFGGVYGEAKETDFTRAVRELVAEGKVEFVSKAKRPHEHVLRTSGQA